VRQLRAQNNTIRLAANTSPTRKLNPELGRPTKKSLVKLLGKNWATVAIWVTVLSLTLPVFRCGGRTGLTFFDWIKEHSIWGSPVQYVPSEDYARELEGTYLQDEELRW